MSRQFVKVLGTGSRPDVYKGAPGNPDIVSPIEVSTPEKDVNGGGKVAPRKRSSRSMLADLRTPRSKTSAPEPRNGSSGETITKPSEGHVEKTAEQRAAEVGEAAFSRSEAAKGSGLRSLNGTTYDINDYKSYVNDEGRAADKEGVTGQRSSSSSTPASTIHAGVSEYSPVASRRDDELDVEHEINKKAVKEYEQKGRGRNPRNLPTSAPVNTEGTNPYDEHGNVKPEYNDPNNIHSTTMHEHNGEYVEGGAHKAPYTKPTVNKPGNVIPQVVIDTYGSMPVDRKQAEKENKRIRENRSIPTTTTVFDPNKISARPVRGQTPERQAVLGAIREGRAASLAAEGKKMTTVAPEVMDTAKRIGRTSDYNLTEDYMKQPHFLAHEAVQKATVAHAIGVHNDLDKLHSYLGGRPLEAKARLAAAFKIVDRRNRGNPEKVPGEFDALYGMIHAGSSPQQTLRAVSRGTKTDVVINGQTPTLPEGSSESRAKHAEVAGKIAQEQTDAPKIAQGSVAATRTAPLAGTNRVAVRRIGQAPEEAEVREFSPQELRNKGKVPSVDDSKSKPGPVEKEVEESSNIVDRLKKGPKLKEADE